MFEQQIAAFYSIKSFMADASVEGPPIESKFFTFFRKSYSRNSGEFIRLESWIANKKNEIDDRDLILQMDLEGKFCMSFAGMAAEIGGDQRPASNQSATQVDVALLMTFLMLRLSRHSRPLSRMTGTRSGEKM